MNCDNYKVTVPYPERPAKPAKNFTTSTGARLYADELEAYESAMIKYRAGVEAYREAEAAMNAFFKSEVLEESGLTGHCKADEVFAMAWEHGHSSGYYEVANWVHELAKLVK